MAWQSEVQKVNMAGKVLLAVFALCHAVEANPIPLKVRLQINAGAKELIARLVETGKASTSRMGNLPPCFSKVDELVQWKQIEGHVEPGPPLNDTWKPGPYVEKSGGYCDTVTALVFKPTSCQLDEFSVERFLQLIEGRRLAFMGCSVTRQHFEYLVGRLRSYRIPEEQNQRTIEYGKLLYPSPKGCAKVIDPSKITDPEKAEEVWEGELTQPCFRQGLNPKQFCYTYNVPGGKGTHAWLCYIYANTDPLSDHNMAAYNALGSRDILVVNTGVHFNLVDNTHDAMIRFVRVMGDAHRERPDRPIFIWRESSAQHFGVTKGGYWPPKEMIRARNALKGVTKDFRCPDHDLEIMRKWDWRNILAKSLLSPLSLPVLPTWILTATQPLSHPQTLRGGTTADCTHFCPKEGGMFEMWSVFLFSIFRPLLKREAELEANPSLRSLPGTPIFWRTANAEIDRDRDSEIST